MNKHIAIAMKNGKSMLYPAHAIGLESVKGTISNPGTTAGSVDTYIYTIKNVYTGEVIGSPDDVEAQRLLLLLSCADK